MLAASDENFGCRALGSIAIGCSSDAIVTGPLRELVNNQHSVSSNLEAKASESGGARCYSMAPFGCQAQFG